MGRSRLGYVSSTNTGTILSAGIPYGTATGGATSSTITVDGQSYTLLTFTSDGNLTVSAAGLFDVLLVGGGGGGGNAGAHDGSTDGGGGGGGQVVGFASLTSIYCPVSTIAVDVGAGASGNASGLDSTIGSIISAQGGGRGMVVQFGPRSDVKASGGSGGGGAYYVTGCSGAAFGGNAGGNGSSPAGAGGGGGGAGAAGSNSGATTGGAGGAGLDISTWLGQAATTTFKAGGGGGAGTSSSGAGGSGGGGAGGSTGTAGTANSGGGGGATSGNGGSGIVYVRFKI